MDAIAIVAVAFFSAGLSELINWVMIYRTDEYNRLKRNIDSLQSDVDKKKLVASSDPDKKKTADKQVKQIEARLSNMNTAMSRFKMWSMFAVGVSLFSVFSFMSQHFDGMVVCKLPFEPLGPIRGLTRRGLPENGDMHQCAYPFLFLLSSVIVRTNLQKILGVAPAGKSSAGGLFGFQPPTTTK